MTQLAASETTWAGRVVTLPLISGRGIETATNGSRAERRNWQSVIDGELAAWIKNPDVLEDEGVEPPSTEIIQLAARIAGELCEAGLPGPKRVAVTGDGGIVFARQEGPLFSYIEVASDRAVELFVFQDWKLLSRRRLR